jgi:hypothetical protein
MAHIAGETAERAFVSDAKPAPANPASSSAARQKTANCHSSGIRSKKQERAVTAAERLIDKAIAPKSADRLGSRLCFRLILL